MNSNLTKHTKPREFDFSKRTIRIISARAGYRCSFAGCEKCLVGPGEGPEGVASLGEIGHIYSGAVDGPRYGSTLTLEQLKSSQNGLLLCRHHHKLVDCLDSSYTVADLIKMKDYHEYRVSSDLAGFSSPFVWIESIVMKDFSLFETNSIIDLGRINHIYGDQGLGKTAILELLTVALTSIPDDRWKGSTLKFEVRLSTATRAPKVVTVKFHEGSISYHLDKHSLPLFPENFFVIFLKRNLRHHADDIEAIRRCYDLPVGFLERLISSPNFKGITTKDYSIKTMRKTPYLSRELFVSIGNRSAQTFRSCSSSEIGRVILDLGIAAATEMSFHRPVLLLVDWINISTLNVEKFVPYIDYLFSSRAHFQTIFVSPDPINKLPWNGWQKVMLEKEQGHTVVNQ